LESPTNALFVKKKKKKKKKKKEGVPNTKDESRTQLDELPLSLSGSNINIEIVFTFSRITFYMVHILKDVQFFSLETRNPVLHKTRNVLEKINCI
jgi:hypothetical protein